METADSLDRRAVGVGLAQISLAAAEMLERKSAEPRLTLPDKLARATTARLLAVPYPGPQLFRYGEFAPHNAADQPADPQKCRLIDLITVNFDPRTSCAFFDADNNL